MSIPLRCVRAEIFNEFTDVEKKDYFNLTEKKFYAEIDNFYFSIFLDEEFCSSGIERFIYDLEKLRECFDFKSDENLDFYGFDYFPFGYKCFNNRLSIPELYDVFVCSSLPNDKTPRILIQLRSRYLWLYNTRVCIKEAYNAILNVLQDYNISVLRVQENRVDYAHHNNAIQNPEKFFELSNMRKHCKTSARIFNQVGNPQNNWTPDYLSVGSRNSRSVFFRIYNKTREVVEQNYKAFFIELWFKNGLINSYDKYCLEYAFRVKSYDVGILCGQLHWYIEFGKDEKRKKYFKWLYEKYFSDNVNTAQLRKNVRKYLETHISYDDINYVRKKLVNVLPPVTIITNIEFETHRDFYRFFNKSLLKINNKSDDILSRVYQIYGCRKAFVNYMSSYGSVVSFVKDSKIQKKKFDNSMYLSFWKRLRSANWNTKYTPDLLRSYERYMDIERAKRRIVSDAAVLSIHKNGLNYNDTTTDFADVFSLLNDNDINMMFVDNSTGELINAHIKYGDYYTVKQHKNRQYRSFFPSSCQDEDK